MVEAAYQLAWYRVQDGREQHDGGVVGPRGRRQHDPLEHAGAVRHLHERHGQLLAPTPAQPSDAAPPSIAASCSLAPNLHQPQIQ